MNENIHLESASPNYLYHFGLKMLNNSFKVTFGDVRFVCVGGSAQRMIKFAELLAEESGTIGSLRNLSGDGARFVLYKIGAVLVADHGIGAPSLSIALNELIKLLYYADCKNVTFLRIGTSGGIDVPPGTLVISDGALNTRFKPEYKMIILGRSVIRKPHLDEDLANELASIGKCLQLNVTTGKTVCADGFYEDQGRLDGAFCDYTEKDKFAYLRRAQALGVRNFEMECTCFAALIHLAGHRAGIVCVTLVNRLLSDQVELEPEDYHTFLQLPSKLVLAYLKLHRAL